MLKKELLEKNFFGIPFKSINLILQLKQIQFKDIDKFVIAGNYLKKYKSYQMISFIKNLNIDFSNEINFFNRLKLLKFLFNKKTLGAYLEDYLLLKGFNGKITYKDHHLCHVASSFATYPIKDSIMLSIDGDGDNINWSLYKYEKNNFKILKRMPLGNDGFVHDSPADIYANVTKLLGYKRNKHEGKLTGLAAFGNPIKIEYFKKLLKFESGKFVCRIPYGKLSKFNIIKRLFNLFFYGIPYDLTMINDMKKNLKNTEPKDIASSLQNWLEEITLEFLDYYSSKYNFKNKNILLSGGLFANVSLNQKIRESLFFKNVFVVPNMGDGGLSLGGCFLESDNNQKKTLFNKIQKNVYYGPSYSETYVLSILNESNLFFYKSDNISEEISLELLNNKIVGLFSNKMEFGPRALGARSILANPADKKINETLNQRLERTEFMPFAPVIRDINVKKFFKNFEFNHHGSKFMTMTYHVSDDLKKLAPAVVHVDNTARPQVIDKDTNSIYYKILENFEKLSNIPVLINTSFNSHEEPIVMSPHDAIKSLKNDKIDILVIDNIIIRLKDSM